VVKRERDWHATLLEVAWWLFWACVIAGGTAMLEASRH
jgi:hypothetical protein